MCRGNVQNTDKMGVADEFVPGTTTTLLLLGLVALVGYSAVAQPVADEPLDTEEVESIVVEEANEVRAERGLSRLDKDAALRSSARSHSANMARNGYVGHKTPGGELPFERYDNCSAGGFSGENVASAWYDKNFVYEEAEVPTVHLSDERDVAEHLVRAWMDSEGHRETLLSEDWERVGVGVSVTDSDEVFAAQAFCSGPLGEE